jgi:hypothetical protein
LPGGTRKSEITLAWFSNRNFLKATACIAAGKRRLCRPFQILSVSLSAKS